MQPVFSDCALLIVDMQEKLLAAMPEKVQKPLVKNIEILIELVRDCGGSIFYVEQNPRGLGHTVPSLKEKLQEAMRIEKTSFSCLGSEEFCEQILPHIPQSLIVVGLESHICVLSTIIDLIAEDEDEELEIFVPLDATASRNKLHWNNALRQMENIGVFVSNTESLVFQALHNSEHEHFKKYLELVQ